MKLNILFLPENICSLDRKKNWKPVMYLLKEGFCPAKLPLNAL